MRKVLNKTESGRHAWRIYVRIFSMYGSMCILLRLRLQVEHRCCIGYREHRCCIGYREHRCCIGYRGSPQGSPHPSSAYSRHRDGRWLRLSPASLLLKFVLLFLWIRKKIFVINASLEQITSIWGICTADNIFVYNCLAHTSLGRREQANRKHVYKSIGQHREACIYPCPYFSMRID